MILILLMILTALLFAAIPAWPYSRNWGCYPSWGVGVAAILLLLLITS